MFLKQLANSFFSQKINSGEEWDYHYVQSGNDYQFNSINKSSIFVLPPKPNLGDIIYFNDGSGSTRWFPVKIHRNGNLIMGEKEHMTCDVPNVNFKMSFVGGYIGWKVEADLRFIQKMDNNHVI